MPPPVTTESTRSRARRTRTRSPRRAGSVSSRLGSQRKPSRKRMVVTTSTAICVSARSGAENHMKVRHTISPTLPTRMSAARRWNLACAAAVSAHRPPAVHSSAKSTLPGTRSRSPQLMPLPPSDAAATATAANTSKNICGCKRWLLARRSARRTAPSSHTSAP